MLWSYDAAGNILSKTEYAFTTGTLGTTLNTIPYTYGDSTWGDLLTAHNGNAISYDGIGNPENDGTWTYTWEHGRQLASMTAEDLDGIDTDTTVTYTYDANGMRTGKVVAKNDYHIHTYMQIVTEPTCTEGGYTTYICSCGDSDIGNITEALGHDYGSLGQEKKCTRCGAERGDIISPIIPPINPPGVEIVGEEDGETTYGWPGTLPITPFSTDVITYSYVYNGSSLSQMTVVTETTENGETTTATETLYFAYDASGTPQTVTYNDTVYYYATNLQGDVVAILNSAGTAVVTYTYNAWGEILTVSGELADTLGAANPLTYRGYVYDAEVGLYYLQSRYYNAGLGRFNAPDAFASTGQGLLGNNMFAYCLNNPVAFSDTTGNAAMVCFNNNTVDPALSWKVHGGGSTNHNGGFAPWQNGYSSESGAAAAFATEVYSASSYSRHEYSTEIYTQVINGTTYYFYTKPQIGGPHQASINMKRVNNIVAYAHTHPNSNVFSDPDKSFADYYGINAYVIGPNLELQMYSPYGVPFDNIPIVPIPLSDAQKNFLRSTLYNSWCDHFVDGKCPNVYYCIPALFPPS